MTTYTEILKNKMKPEDYRRIPRELRKRPEPDLFAPLIWNLLVEEMNNRKHTPDEIEAACRLYDPRTPDLRELLHPGDTIRIMDVFGNLEKPYDHLGISCPKTVFQIGGPYTREWDYITPPNWSIVFTDKGVIHNMIPWHGLICSMWRTNITWIEIMKGGNNKK